MNLGYGNLNLYFGDTVCLRNVMSNGDSFLQCKKKLKIWKCSDEDGSTSNQWTSTLEKCNKEDLKTLRFLDSELLLCWPYAWNEPWVESLREKEHKALLLFLSSHVSPFSCIHLQHISISNRPQPFFFVKSKLNFLLFLFNVFIFIREKHFNRIRESLVIASTSSIGFRISMTSFRF